MTPFRKADSIFKIIHLNPPASPYHSCPTPHKRTLECVQRFQVNCKLPLILPPPLVLPLGQGALSVICLLNHTGARAPSMWSLCSPPSPWHYFQSTQVHFLGGCNTGGLGVNREYEDHFVLLLSRTVLL